MQLSMVLQTLHGTASGNYIQQLICRSELVLSAIRLQRAFAILLDRHDALRLQFRLDGEEIAQMAAETAVVPIEWRRWEGLQASEDFMLADRKRGFDLRQAPLIRITAFIGAPDPAHLVITYHHALLDGRSRRIVLRELFELLETDEAFAGCHFTPAVPFARYLEWNSKKDHSGSLSFWKEYLRGVPAALDLPLPKPVSSNAAGSWGFQRGMIPESETALIRTFAGESGCSLNNVVQAAWAIVLSRYTGSDEVVFGTTRACRHSAMNGAAAQIVGLLINSVPIRMCVPAGTTVLTVLVRLKELQRRIREHENTPIEQVLQASDLRPGEALYRAYLMFDEAGETESPGFRNWRCELREQTEMLSLSVRAGAKIELGLEFDRTRYSDAAMARLLHDFSATLREIALDRKDEIDALGVSRPSLANNARNRSPEFGSVIEAVKYWARVTPDQPAVLSDEGALTYSGLDRRSNEAAHSLLATGLHPGDLVCVSIERSADLIVAFLGIWKAGCAYVPLDRRYPDDLRAYMMKDSGAATILNSLPDRGGCPDTSPDLNPVPDSPAYVIYTSGSTGKPKGVLISQHSLTNLCAGIAEKYEIVSTDRILQATTINFDISVEEIFPTLWKGATLVLVSDQATSSIADFGDFIERHQCSVVNIPTAFWHELVTGLHESGRKLAGSLRLLVVGGERALPEIYALWKTLPEAARVRWLNAYGPTETTVTATVFEPPADGVEGNLPIGRPIRGVSAYILDSRMRPLPLEAAGELFIGGKGVALGYLNAPELTKDKFLPDPFNPAGKMYRTGDRARLLESGDIEFLGRTDFQVKFRGYRIELGEVEAAAESHPQVTQAIAQVRPGSALVLFVARSGSELTADPLKRWLAERLVQWMVPTAIVVLEKLPSSVGGKIDRAALAAMPVQTSELSTFLLPETDLERELLRIWESLFQNYSIKVDDNFFSLGGYSLLAMRMLVQVEKLTGRTFRFADLSRAPTIRQFARTIAGEKRDALPECLVMLRQSGAEPPLFCFHGAGGVVHWYNDLALRIPNRPVIGIQCRENPDRALPQSLEEMCQYYLEAIRHVQPTGPYYFLGHSMGGMLAYHCAVLCARRGDTVSFVCSLDGWNRAEDHPPLLTKIGRWLQYFWRLDTNAKIAFATDKIRWLRFERSQMTTRASLGSTEDSFLSVVKANNIKLARTYVAPPYSGVMHVFRAQTRGAAEPSDPTLGWGQVARNVVAIEVPGTHFTLLSPPNVDILAATLGELLAASSIRNG
jgi:amino acid adenylation domain-containing protein